jgi:hypothetical protein
MSEAGYHQGMFGPRATIANHSKLSQRTSNAVRKALRRHTGKAAQNAATKKSSQRKERASSQNFKLVLQRHKLEEQKARADGREIPTIPEVQATMRREVDAARLQARRERSAAARAAAAAAPAAQNNQHGGSRKKVRKSKKMSRKTRSKSRH